MAGMRLRNGECELVGSECRSDRRVQLVKRGQVPLNGPRCTRTGSEFLFLFRPLTNIILRELVRMWSDTIFFFLTVLRVSNKVLLHYLTLRNDQPALCTSHSVIIYIATVVFCITSVPIDLLQSSDLPIFVRW